MFRRIFQGIVAIIMRIVYKLSPKVSFDDNGIVLPKEPVLFLSNHQGNLDALKLRVHCKRRIVFVVHEEVYRRGLYRLIAKHLIDTIKRGCSKTDIGYIKELFRAKQRNLSIGIYPEGGINYFNDSIRFGESTAKLCKKLDMPIVLVNVNGATFGRPRWAKHQANYRSETKFKRLITREELQNLSVAELDAILQTELYVNDYDWQRANLMPVNRIEPCANLERALCVCPDCNSIGDLKFSSNSVYCRHCNHTFTLDKYDFVVGSDNATDLVQWNAIQTKALDKYVKKFNPSDVILQADNLIYNKADLNGYFRKHNQTNAGAKLYCDRIEITSNGNTEIYQLAEFFKVYVEFGNVLQLHCDDYKIRLTSDNFFAQVWVSYIHSLLKK